MEKWTAKRWLTAIVVAAGVGLNSSPSAADDHLITIGTASKAGVYYPAGGAICDMVNARRWVTGLRCVAEATKGSVDNLEAIRAGTLDLAIVQSDWQYNAVNGTSIFKQAGPDLDLRAVFALHAEPFTIVARPDSGIQSIDDLKGKRVNIGTPGSGSRASVDVVLDALGWSVSTFKLATQFTTDEQASALCTNQIDAIMAFIGHPNQSVHDMTAGCNALLIQAKGPAIDALVARTPYFWPAVIPGGLYPDLPEPTQTFALGAALVSSTRVDPDIIYQVVRAVFENFDTFRGLHPALEHLDKSQMVRQGLTAPLHPGAIRYYLQLGLL